ncbi:MAG: dienelactone hydrolase family protein [Devosia sp.]|uniref:dienelactone hydrolase family protein n=1 Tax=Devosia sp. TaxID=1871048 RepID=UPI001A475300|nr:dienelactone hydrolase family protein [Devosia sp.]MBL8600094.1 dienelactone hydrolase family protein [Devosia sp.]
MPRITLTASDGFTLNAYRAEPAGKPRGGVVLFGEVWGLNNWVRAVADRWASHGYLCVAPAMFDRVEFGYESENYGQDQFKVINRIFESYSHATALLDMRAAVEAASAAGQVGVTGYCFGGANSWRAAAQVAGVAAASGYYGGGVPNYIGLTPRVPIEMHFGTRDQGIPLEQVEQLKAAHPDVDIHTYDADHGFCNSDRPNRFDEAACTKASARSLAWFHKHLG